MLSAEDVSMCLKLAAQMTLLERSEHSIDAIAIDEEEPIVELTIEDQVEATADRLMAFLALRQREYRAAS